MKAWQLIEKPQNWTTGVIARNKDNKIINTDDPSACKFCCLGAIKLIYGEKELWKQRNKLMPFTDGLPISIWNDTSTHETVVNILKQLDI